MLGFELLLNGLRKFTQYISHLQTFLADIQLLRIRNLRRERQNRSR